MSSKLQQKQEGKSAMIDYNGTDINIEEMPQGCVISHVDGRPHISIVISSIEDARAVIASLEEMIKVQYGEENKLVSAAKKVIDTFEKKTRMFDALMEMKKELENHA